MKPQNPTNTDKVHDFADWIDFIQIKIIFTQMLCGEVKVTFYLV